MGIFDRIKRKANDEFVIAITGTILSGKSTLINALIGREVALPIWTSESTYLTRYRSTLERDYVKVSFYSSHEWNQLFGSITNCNDSEIIEEFCLPSGLEIKESFLDQQDIIIKTNSAQEMQDIVFKFTSVNFSEHYFIKEIEIGLANCLLAPNTEIVDISILNHPIDYFSNIQRILLNQANLVLFCKKSSSAEIRSDELSTLIRLFSDLKNAKNRVYIVGTQIDVQPNMNTYWENFTLPEYVEYFKGTAFFGTDEKAKEHIIPASAWYFLCAIKAAENPELWKEKGMQKTLREMICRLYDYVPLEELIEEYGEEEAYERFKSPKKIFELNYDAILTQSGIPRLIDFLNEKKLEAVSRLCDEF